MCFACSVILTNFYMKYVFFSCFLLNQLSLLSNIIFYLCCNYLLGVHKTSLRRMGDLILSGTGNIFEGLKPNNWAGNGFLILANGEGKLVAFKRSRKKIQSSSLNRVNLQNI